MSKEVKCPKCGSTDLIYQSGQRYFCSKCNLSFIGPERMSHDQSMKSLGGSSENDLNPVIRNAEDRAAVAVEEQEKNRLIESAKKRRAEMA
jgi:hypothetical protein